MIVNRTTIPTAPLTSIVQWVLAHMSEAARRANVLFMHRKWGAGIGGHASTMAFARGRVSRGLPQSEPLVSISIGPAWEQRKYPVTETYKKRAGSCTYLNWQEHLVTLLAHEFRHIEQYAMSREDRKKLGSHEVDAERHAFRLLALYRKAPIEESLSNAAKKETKECPRCHREGEIATMFGFRTIKGKKVIPQSYCHECRRVHARERRGS